MQTILGAGGAIGFELARVLPQYTKKVRLVSRNPHKVNDRDELFIADLTKEKSVDQAVQGSDVVYLTAGLKYDLKTWQKEWPLIMSNVLNACKKHNARLVFFDNIYVYDLHYFDNITEKTPVNPPSEKGEVRARITEMLMDESKKGNIKAQIARSADFYGPFLKNSMIGEMVIKRLKNRQSALWPVSTDYKHSFTYTPDAARALALLGNNSDTYGKIWHMPTASDPLTGRQWIEALAKEMNVKPKIMIASKFMFRALGLFMPVMRESAEMLYQYDRDYIFNSSKFEKRFPFVPTDYQTGIKEVVRSVI